MVDKAFDNCSQIVAIATWLELLANHLKVRIAQMRSCDLLLAELCRLCEDWWGGGGEMILGLNCCCTTGEI